MYSCHHAPQHDSQLSLSYSCSVPVHQCCGEIHPWLACTNLLCCVGGSVSKALELASQHSCYQSVVTYRGQLLLLGVDVVHCLTIRKWDERLAVLVRDSQFPEALALAMTFYRGTARAVVGLSHNPDERREIVSGQMIDVLLAYVDLSLATHVPDDDHIEEQEQFYKVSESSS